MNMLTEDQIAKCIVLAMGGRDGVVYCADRRHAEKRFTQFCQLLVDMGERGRCLKDFNELTIDFNPGSIHFRITSANCPVLDFSAVDQMPRPDNVVALAW